MIIAEVSSAVVLVIASSPAEAKPRTVGDESETDVESGFSRTVPEKSDCST